MRFTLFTPVFNRVGTLSRVWNSIRRQSCTDFEWICVDDGSVDGSIDLLREYRDSADFPVTVLSNDGNRGKHVAWNAAVAAAQGELFVPCDSDDEFDSDSLEFFSQQWAALTAAEREQASGINVLCRDATTGETVGTPFPASPLWSNNLELSYRYRVVGEKWGCIRTDLLKRMMFPSVRGYYPEGYLWYKLARTHRTLCLNRALRTYYRDQPNQISSRVPHLSRLPAAYDYSCWHVRQNWDYIALDRREALLEGSNVYYFGFLLGHSVAASNERLQGAAAKRMWPILSAIGWMRYMRAKRQQQLPADAV